VEIEHLKAALRQKEEEIEDQQKELLGFLNAGERHFEILAEK
jgi:hypothetical protein